MCRRLSIVILFCAALLLPTSRADVPLPPNVMNPATVGEAWNVIRLVRANVVRLLKEKRLSEVPEQVSLCSPALRVLARANMPAEHRVRIDEQTMNAFRSVNSVAQACMARSQPDADKSFAELQSAFTGIEAAFDAKEVGGEIYYCPAHPEVISITDGTKCKKCATPLLLRRIPYSFIYVAPDPPTIKLSVETGAPLVAGKKAEARASLRTIGGAPVTLSDLLVVHSQPVHLFITDAALEDFQIVHPVPDAVPGDYTFSFTPAKSGPGRMWADIVPAVTGLQELPFADLGGSFVPEAPKGLADVLTAKAGGFAFQMTFAGVPGGQARARQIQLMRVHVSDEAGQPVQRLEPFMNAFAHVVGFYDDYQTVVRLHPVGGDILNQESRGGPYLGFKFYPPRGGFMRFFCQVRIDGRTITVPFSANVIQ